MQKHGFDVELHELSVIGGHGQGPAFHTCIFDILKLDCVYLAENSVVDEVSWQALRPEFCDVGVVYVVVVGLKRGCKMRIMVHVLFRLVSQSGADVTHCSL